MDKFIIEGGVPLKGTVKISGAKNAALKMIAASLLTGEEVVLSNVPNIRDIEVIIDMVRNFGTEARWVDDNKLSLRSPSPVAKELPREITRTTRSGVVLMAPLLARYGKFSMSSPGGCDIGIRPINRHIEALRTFGAEVGEKDGSFFGEIPPQGLRGAEINFEKVTVMGTETAILAAVTAQGQTVISNAAAEPEVDDLISLLKEMGAKIERKNERLIEIEGVSYLHGTSHEVIPDRNEAATYAVAAAATRGDVVLSSVITSHLTSFLAKLQKIGVNFEVGKNSLRVWLEKDRVLESIDIETSPYPGFMTDWQQPFCVLLTQAQGLSHIHETIYLHRFEYIRELNRMGAKIELLHPSSRGFKPHTDEEYEITKDNEPETLAEITGPTPLSGRRLNISDLRAGATLVIAALTAFGQSEVLGVEHIDRGYENFDRKLLDLGAGIKRVSY
ncbi:MAG: UDP-N-acetylglucosamine 1-carboxyvinyltransferase [Patescibacteria group bacterium]|nr:UDP-N-acetylglucosamine 1-carboxyvinyltransferase [Patescibacteria group bacterium]